MQQWHLAYWFCFLNVSTSHQVVQSYFNSRKQIFTTKTISSYTPQYSQSHKTDFKRTSRGCPKSHMKPQKNPTTSLAVIRTIYPGRDCRRESDIEWFFLRCIFPTPCNLHLIDFPSTPRQHLEVVSTSLYSTAPVEYIYLSDCFLTQLYFRPSITSLWKRVSQFYQKNTCPYWIQLYLCHLRQNLQVVIQVQFEYFTFSPLILRQITS